MEPACERAGSKRRRLREERLVEDVKKYVDFAYVLAFLLFAWVFTKVIESVWRIFDGAPNPELFFGVTLTTLLGIVAAAGTTIYLRVNPRIYTLVTECGVELKKTIWPSWPETRSNTLVVISVTFILGFILWFFDFIWKSATDLLYP